MFRERELLLMGLHVGKVADMDYKKRKSLQKVSPLCWLLMRENLMDYNKFEIDMSIRQEWYSGQIY